MDVKILFMPSIISDLLMLVGVLKTCQALTWSINNLLSLYYHRETYKKPTELRYHLILQENKNLKQRIETLEKENTEVFSSIINKFNN
jgi:hypothetical protein